jgi:hypothetical protein
MALVRCAFAPIALTAAGCLLALLLIPPIANAWMARVTRAESAVPCHSQQWPNADRICLTWTAPHDTAPRGMDARTDGRRP